MGKKAMVIGAKGMDGSHMCDLLASKDYQVYEITRKDSLETIAAYAKQVDEIYNFSGVSDVINPFENVMAVHNDTLIPLTVLEAIKGTKVRFFQASSPLKDYAVTPYSASKLYAHSLVETYKNKQGVYSVGGIMYSHESERRKDHFFSQKVIKAAINREKITLGCLEKYQDFGYAPDYVEAAWMMLQQQEPGNYILATGRRILLSDFVDFAFQIEGLNYKDYVTETKVIGTVELDLADLYYTESQLGWKAKHNVYATIAIMNRHAKAL